jgi:hypothetical protein
LRLNNVGRFRHFITLALARVNEAMADVRAALGRPLG